MKILFIAMVLGVWLKGCSHEVPNQDFCNIANRTFYNGGSFKFTAEEVAGLSRENREKLYALKKTYREICLGG